MFFWKNRNKKTLTVTFPEESREECVNPGRGWYHIYTFALDEINAGDLLYLPSWDHETLVLLRFDIGAFRGQVISGEALEFAGKILEHFHRLNKDIILRILYDTQGKGMEREPALFSMILTHMRQLGAVVRAHESDIFLVQGLFVGNWGEMHGSKFLDQEYIKELYTVWREALGENIKIALRKPSFCRKAVFGEKDGRYPGVFDDAVFGSEDHLGTFGKKKKKDSTWEEDWCAADELLYMKENCGEIPFGGEVLSGVDADENETLRTLQDFRVSYLNSIYEEKVLERWKQTIYKEWGSLYQYIGAHLGYRFVAKSAEIYQDRVELVLENTGFSNLCDRAELVLVREGPGEIKEIHTSDYDIRTLAGGGTAKILFPLSGSLEEKEHFYLTLTRARGKAAICFANEGAGERLYLR